MGAKHFIGKSRRGRLVSFDQSSDFYMRRAYLSQERGRLLEALGFLRKANEKEPDNIDFQLELAQLYTRMGCYDESNRIIFHLLGKPQYPSECFFGMALNFMGLAEYDKAQEGCLAYLLAEPEGDYALDCEDMLDSLELTPEANGSSWQLAMRGKAALDSGDIERALRLLTRAVEETPELTFARNNLALALYHADRTSEAIEHTEAVLEIYEDDAFALANMVLFLARKNPFDSRILEYYDKAEECAGDDPDMLQKIVNTACALGWHDRAYRSVKNLLRVKPYDVETLFYAASAAVHLDNLEEAVRYLERAQRIQPDSSVIEYYLAELRQGRKSDMPYHMQVPDGEMIRRMRYLNEIVREGSEATAAAYEDDESFRRYIWWGLEIPDKIFKRAIVNIASVLNPQDAQFLLKDFIIRREENDEIKREAMGLLKQIGAPEPYLAYIDRQIVEVQVSMLDHNVRIPVAYERILRRVTEALRAGPHPETAGIARRIWLAYINALGSELPKIRSTKSWCAALTSIALEKSGSSYDLRALIQNWGTRLPSVEKHREAILSHIGDWDK